MDAKGKEGRDLDHVLSQFAYKCDHSNEKVLKKSEIMSKQTRNRRMADVQALKVSPYFEKRTKKQDTTNGNCKRQLNLTSQVAYKGCGKEKLLKEGENVSKKKSKKRKADEQVRKVSPYFQSSGEKQDMINGNRKVKPEVVKLSPFFQKNNGILNGMKKPRKTAGVKPFLCASQKRDEAYQRKTPDNTWIPPRSNAPLLQEDHTHDPWRVLVICMLLNKTSGNQVSFVQPNLIFQYAFLYLTVFLVEPFRCYSFPYILHYDFSF
ncbi:hypothetical protein PTKIN_Ptkin18bG0026900 [Pterospermum kingtungense]